MTLPATIGLSRLGMAALTYARDHGFAVFPLHSVSGGECSCGRAGCGNAGKHPRTRDGFKSATRDERRIRSWWEQWPDANVGIATGAASGIVVLDIDPRSDGDESLAALELEHGRLPETPTVLTGGGGQHFFFRLPDGANLKGRGGYRHGVDVKADGGYVVAAPSTHASGGVYQWDSGARVDETTLAACPEWLVRACVHSGAPGAKASKGAAGDVLDSLLGRAFVLAGKAQGQIVRDGKLLVECPWEHEHTSGHRYDSSTVVFPPREGSNVGGFRCLHGHCDGRTVSDVLAELPPEALHSADVALKRAQAAGATARAVAPESAGGSTAPEPDWRQALCYDAKSQLLGTAGNVALLLANRDEWRGCLGYDAFADRIAWTADPPSMPGLRPPRVGDDLRDVDLTYVAQWISLFVPGVHKVPDGAIAAGVAKAAHERTRDPLTEYLSGLTWDGVARIDSWLSDFAGANRDAYTRQIGRWWLISAVARALHPGAQVDHMLVLEGPQGARKSSIVRALGGQWYSGELPSLQDSERAGMALQGSWIVEVAELDALRGAAASRTKDFITRTSDRYRAPWARHHVTRPRRCVFIGTTNETQYLSDATGGRRYWPVRVGACDAHGLAMVRDQLWAEAAAAYRAGDRWWPEGEEHGALTEAQAERRFGDAWEEQLQVWAMGRTRFTTAEALTQGLGLERRDWTPHAQARVATALRLLGYEQARWRGPGGERLRGWSLE